MNPDPVDQLLVADIVFGYGKHRVLDRVSLRLSAGEVVALLGRNGAGKSTLLRILLGLLKPQGGRVEMNGKPLHHYARRALAARLAYLPQTHLTAFPYPVRDIVLMGRLPAHGWLGAPGQPDIDAAEALLARFGIHHLAERPYTEISGGERQLALLARAMIQGARMLIMDEPMSGLDYGRQMQLLQHLGSLARDGYAVLLTTHHPEQALLAASRVAVLMDGRVVADGAAEAIVTPQMIRTLYGVEVAAYRSPGGHVAFHPVDVESAADWS